MPAVTFDVSEPVAARLRLRAGQADQILEAGLRAVEAEAAPGYQSAAEILECLARLPDPVEILALRASASLQRRVEALIQRKKRGSSLAARVQ
jgi:hypothetical protein